MSRGLLRSGHGCFVASGLSLAAALLAAGCGGEQGEPGLSSLVRLVPEAAGDNCERGGTRVLAGVDTNRNGTLEDGEVSSTSFFCNAADGRDGSTCTSEKHLDGATTIRCGEVQVVVRDGRAGAATLLRVEEEAVGVNCPAGGWRIVGGTDLDGDGVLAENEADSVAYACNGHDGNGCTALDVEEGRLIKCDDGTEILVRDGKTGDATLVRVTPEPKGEACPEGGSRIDAGTDLNGNGMLDPDEATTSYACTGARGEDGEDGEDGATALIRTGIEPRGSACPDGGTRVFAGVDRNGNGELDEDEIQTESVVCGGPARACSSLDSSLSLKTALDALSVAAAGCSRIEGDLEVEGASLSSLQGLEGLVEIGGDLIIRGNSRLRSIAALAGLTSVGGAVVIAANPLLLEIDLPLLGSVGGDLQVKVNHALERMSLADLESVGESIQITGNSEMESLLLPSLRTTRDLLVAGNAALSRVELSAVERLRLLVLESLPALAVLYLDALVTVGSEEEPGKLHLQHNQALQSVSAPLLRTVYGNLLVEQAPALSVLEVPSLERVGWWLRLWELGALRSWSAPALTSVGSMLALDALPVLERLDGLPQLASLEEFRVSACASLTSVELPALLEGTVQVADNPNVTSVRLGENTRVRLGLFGNPALAEVHAEGMIDGSFSLSGSPLVDCSRLHFDSAVSLGYLALGPGNDNLAELGCLGAVKSIGVLNLTQSNVSSVELDQLGALGVLQLSQNEALTTFRLPVLQTVADSIVLEVNQGAMVLELPLLQEIGGSLSVYSDAVVRMDLSALASVGDEILLEDNDMLSALDVRSLVSVGSSLQLLRNPSLDQVDAQSLRTVAGDLSLEGNAFGSTDFLAALETIGGDLKVWNTLALDRLELPSLLQVGGGLNVSTNSVLLLLQARKLAEVWGAVQLVANPLLGSADLGGLGLADEVHVVANPSLQSLDLERLAWATTVRVSTNASLLELDLPELDTAGLLEVSGNPSLAHIRANSLTDLLNSAEISDCAHLLSASFDSLDRIGGWLTVSRNERLVSLSLPLLSTSSNLRVEDNAALPTLSLPELEVVAGWLVSISRNASLSNLVLPSLQTIYGSLVVEYNPLLPQCQAEAIAAQIDFTYYAGPTIRFNDVNAVCE